MVFLIQQSIETKSFFKENITNEKGSYLNHCDWWANLKSPKINVISYI